jgi:hypothetical protein
MRGDLFVEWCVNNPPSPPLQHPPRVPGIRDLQPTPNG